MNNINFEKFFKYGFIASIVMVGIGALMKMRMLIALFEVLAIICGALLAGIIITDLLGWRKSKIPVNQKQEPTNKDIENI